MAILLRSMTKGDLELVLAWRSNPLNYKGYYEQGYLGKGPLTWEEHLDWWKRKWDWVRWIIQVSKEERPVGLIWISFDGEIPEVALLIGEVTLQGKGVGKEALQEVLSWLQEKGYKEIQAKILKDNERSRRLFESLGFKYVGDSREGEDLYFRRLDEEA